MLAYTPSKLRVLWAAALKPINSGYSGWGGQMAKYIECNIITALICRKLYCNYKLIYNATIAYTNDNSRNGCCIDGGGGCSVDIHLSAVSLRMILLFPF